MLQCGNFACQTDVLCEVLQTIRYNRVDHVIDSLDAGAEPFRAPDRYEPHSHLLLASSVEFRLPAAAAFDEPVRRGRARGLLGGARSGAAGEGAGAGPPDPRGDRGAP